MKKIIVPLFFLSLILTCCVPSLHPLYTEKDLILDDRIIGEWREGGSSDSWEFTPTNSREEKSYILTMTQEDGLEYSFSIHLVKLEDQLYMDFFPMSLWEGKKHNYFPETFYGYHWLPMHTFAKIEFVKDQLVIRFFDPEWVEDLIKKSKIRIKHEKVYDGFFLTASSEELQKFILKYGKEEGAFSEEAFLERDL